jgi:4-hydroxybenzoate polyprenyltransferase
MAFAAHGARVDLAPWLLFAANVCWAAAYDTMYAMADRDEDVKIGVKSTAVLFAQHDRLIVALLQAATLGLLLAVGELAGLGAWYRAGLVAAALFGLYQQYLIRSRAPAHCFAAFLNNNWFGAAVFAGILLHYTFTV